MLALPSEVLFMADDSFKIVGLLALFGGATQLVTYALQRTRARGAGGWQQVPGTVTASDVVPRGEDYSADVTYDYVVYGRRFTGTRRDFQALTRTTRDEALARARRWQVGQAVAVFVNPANPFESVLDPIAHLDEASYLIKLGVALIVAGVAVLLFG